MEPNGVSVTRVGTQVVVRLSGQIGDEHADRLGRAGDEVSELVLSRVVVDLTEATDVSGAGLEFLREAQRRWKLRLLDPPAGLREALADRPPAPPGDIAV